YHPSVPLFMIGVQREFVILPQVIFPGIHKIVNIPCIVKVPERVAVAKAHYIRRRKNCFHFILFLIIRPIGLLFVKKYIRYSICLSSYLRFHFSGCPVYGSVSADRLSAWTS